MPKKSSRKSNLKKLGRTKVHTPGFRSPKFKDAFDKQKKDKLRRQREGGNFTGRKSPKKKSKKWETPSQKHARVTRQVQGR